MFRQWARLIIGKEIRMGWNVQEKYVWILSNVSLWYLRKVCCCCSTFMLMIGESVDIWMIFLRLCWSYILQSHRWCLLKVCLQWCEMPIDAGHFLLIVASALKRNAVSKKKAGGFYPRVWHHDAPLNHICLPLSLFYVWRGSFFAQLFNEAGIADIIAGRVGEHSLMMWLHALWRMSLPQGVNKLRNLFYQIRVQINVFPRNL